MLKSGKRGLEMDELWIFEREEGMRMSFEDA